MRYRIARNAKQAELLEKPDWNQDAEFKKFREWLRLAAFFRIAARAACEAVAVATPHYSLAEARSCT
jgi:hypothetical protein